MADKCDDCSKNSDRTCLKCHKSLCHICCFDHEIYNTDHYCRFPPLQKYNTSCKQHYHEVRGFCYECNELVCFYCQQESHIKHHIGQIDDVAWEKRSLVGKEILKCEQKAEQIKKQLEQRRNNHKEIKEKVKLLEGGLRKATGNSLAYQKLPSVLDPRQNEKLSQILQEIKSLNVLEVINNEELKTLKNISTCSQYTPAWFLSGYLEYRKYYEHIVFPDAVNDHFIPLNIGFKESGDEVQPRTMRGYERMEHSRPIYKGASAIEPLAEHRNQETFLNSRRH